MTEAQKLAKYLEERNEGYTCRVLADGSVACMFDLLFTRAIALGCTRDTYSHRFCFESKRTAQLRFLQLDSQNDEPVGYVAKRIGSPVYRTSQFNGD